MTEQQHPSGDRPAYQPTPLPPPRSARPLAALLTVLLLVAAGYGGWRGYQWLAGTFGAMSEQQETLARVTRELSALRAQADALASRQTELAQTVRRDVGSLGGRLESSELAVARLGDTVEGGRTRLQLAAVEQLLLMANDRLQLAHDAPGALKALELADERLALLNDPRLFRVREQLATERGALAKLALPDYTGLSLALAELLKRAPDLPLRVRVPERFEIETDAAPTAPAVDGGAAARIWAAVKHALANIFALHRTSGPAPRLLAPDEEALVEQILQLKLEGARLALLAADGRTFSELVGAARAWLDQYYDEADPNVRTSRAELERMARLQLAPALPDIGRSLALLRGRMDAGPK